MNIDSLSLWRAGRTVCGSDVPSLTILGIPASKSEAKVVHEIVKGGNHAEERLQKSAINRGAPREPRSQRSFGSESDSDSDSDRNSDGRWGPAYLDLTRSEMSPTI